MCEDLLSWKVAAEGLTGPKTPQFVNALPPKHPEILHISVYTCLRAFSYLLYAAPSSRWRLLHRLRRPHLAHCQPFSAVRSTPAAEVFCFFIFFCCFLFFLVFLFFSCARKTTPLCEIIESVPPELCSCTRNEKQAEISTSLDQW